MAKSKNLNKSCLFCQNSFSLPANEAFDDGTVSEYDRLVCVSKRRVVRDEDTCEERNNAPA